MSAPDRVSRAALSRRLIQVGRPVLGPLGTSVVARTVALLCGVAQLALAAAGVARVVTGWGGIGGVVLALVAVSVVRAVARYVEQLAGHTVAFKALAILRGAFYDRLEPQAPAATEGRRTGDLLARATRDVDRVEVFFAHTLAPAVTAVLVPVAVVLWLALGIHPGVAGVAAAGFLAAGLLVPRLADGSAAAAARELRVARGEVAQHVTDTVQGVREVASFGAEERRLAELAERSDAVGRGVRGGAGVTALRRGLNAALVPLTLLGVLLVAAGPVLAGTLTWADAVVAVAVVLGTVPAVLAVEDFAADLGQAYASAERVFEVIDAAPAVADPTDPEPVPATPGLSLTGVTYTYPTRTAPALVGVDLELASGTTTAIVGVSGSGKSTLAGLLLRFADPTAGTVRLGGVDVRRLRQSDLRTQVTLVQQRPYLFHDTIEANLRLARPDATRAQLDEACRRAALTEWIASLPRGYDTVVGDQGARLSGGQRQRLAVARALLRDAPVLVLDEVTSELDGGTEAEVLAALAELRRGRTVVLIAHRLSTVVDADRIVVMDAGRVVEQGSHAELVTAGGHYAALLDRERDDLDAVETI